MPIPSPNKNEKEKKFLPRCMSNETMVKEYKDVKQRFAVCKSQFDRSKKKKD